MAPAIRRILHAVLALTFGLAGASGSRGQTAEASNAPVYEGQRLVLAAEVGGGQAPFTYQWYKNGALMPGQVGESLVFSAVRLEDAGLYAVVVSNSGGSAVSLPDMVSVVAVAGSRLANVSIVAPTGESLVVGFVLGGASTSGSNRVLARAAGPALAQFGVSPTLPDPVLSIFDQERLIGSNDDWSGELVTSTAAAVGAFPFGANSRDAAIVLDLPRANYTAEVRDRTGGAGTTVMELYEAPRIDAALPPPRFVNVSARGVTGSGGGKLIAGFTVNGQAPMRVLIRGVGPTLARFEVSGALSDPSLTLYRQSAIVGTNDGWGTGDIAALTAAATAVGAFALPDKSADAALLLTLEPGSYTAQLSSRQGATGVALIELYEVP